MLGGGGVDFLYQFRFSVPRFSNNRVQAGVARLRPLIAQRSYVFGYLRYIGNISVTSALQQLQMTEIFSSGA